MPDAYRPGRSRYGAVTNVLAVVAVVDLVGEHGDLAFDPHVPALVSTRAPAWDDVFETLRVGARFPRPLTGLPRFNPTMEGRLPMAGEASQRDGRRVPVARRDEDSGRVPAQRTLGRHWRRHSLVRLSAPYIERWSRQLQGLPMNARLRFLRVFVAIGAQHASNAFLRETPGRRYRDGAIVVRPGRRTRYRVAAACASRVACDPTQPALPRRSASRTDPYCAAGHRVKSSAASSVHAFWLCETASSASIRAAPAPTAAPLP